MPASEILLSIKTNTKEEEEDIIRQFLARLEYNPTAFKASECPDFEIQVNGKLIGTEVTKYYADFTKNGSSIQEKFSEWVKLAKKLKLLLKENNPSYDYLYGAMHFHKRAITYKELLKDKFFKELLLLIQSNDLKNGESSSIEIGAETYPNLFQHIESLYLSNTYPENKYLWWDGSLQSGAVIQNENALQAIVDKKIAATNYYKDGYFQKWLIVYAGGIGLHDMYVNHTGKMHRQGRVTLTNLTEVRQLKNSEVIPNYFTHIFLWDKFTEVIYQLHPYEKVIFDYGKKEIHVNHLPLK